MTTATAPAYRDPKRHVWVLSLLVPCSVALGPLLMLYTGDARLLWIQVVFFYLLIPLIDFMVGEDRSNPPESAVPATLALLGLGLTGLGLMRRRGN